MATTQKEEPKSLEKPETELVPVVAQPVVIDERDFNVPDTPEEVELLKKYFAEALRMAGTSFDEMLWDDEELANEKNDEADEEEEAELEVDQEGMIE